MAYNLTTTSDVDPAVQTYYDRVLLRRAVPKLVHKRFAQIRNIPKHSGDMVKFRRYNSLTPATTPLVEGVTPPGERMSKTDLTAQVSQYGNYVHVTDKVDLTNQDKVLTEAGILLGENMGLTLDTITRDILIACASSTNCAYGNNGATPTELSKRDIDLVVKTLLGGEAEMIAGGIVANGKVGTAPIRPAFWGFLHTDLMDALEAVSNFKSTSEYPSQQAVDDAEWGGTGNVRWLMSSNCHKDTSTSPDTYKCIVVGKDAYGCTEIEAGTVANIIKAFGSGGTADPLNQRMTSGWKAMFVARILNDAWMHQLVCSNLAASG